MWVRSDENQFLKENVRAWVMTDYIAVADCGKKKLHIHKDIPASCATFHVYLLISRGKQCIVENWCFSKVKLLACKV